MSDKKRSISPNPLESDVSVAKKQKVTAPSSTLPPELLSGKLTFRSVREFKKEALIRAISSYKRTSDLFESQAKKSQKRLALLEKVFSIQESWIQNIFDQFDTALANNKPLPIPGSIVKDNFLLDIEKNDNDDNVSDDQSQDNDDTRNKEDKLLSSYKVKTRDLKEKIEKLLQWDGKTNDANDLRLQTSTALKDFHTIEADYNILKANTQNLESQLQEMTTKYLDAQKDISKLQSPVTNALLGNKLEQEPQEPEKPAAVAEAPETKNEQLNGSEKEKVDTEELKELELKLDQAKAVIEKQHQQLKDQDNQIVSLNETIRHTNNRLAHLTDADLQHSHIYRSLRRRVDDLLNQLDRLDQINAQYARDKSNLISERAEFQERLRRDYDARLDEMQARLTRAESDVSRIRAARDEMLSSLSIKKAADADRTKSFEQMKELVAIRETRIKSLEEEIRRFKANNTNDEAGKTDPELETSSIDELKQLVCKLKRDKSSLEAELPDLEAAFNSAHQKATAKVMDYMDREAKMNKLNVEKTKADEKYFSAMRSKDALNAEYQKVRSQLSRNAEWIQQLKDTERKNQHQIGVLEHKVDDMQMKIDTLERDRNALNGKCTESERRGDSLRALTDRLEVELKNKDKAIRNEVEARRQTEQEVAKLNKQIEVQSIGLKGGSGSMRYSGVDGKLRSPNSHGTMSTNGGGDLEMQIQELRTIAICSVCSKNWKDTAIKVCGHVFCESCAVDRLTARLRKCPLCNKQYSHSDLLPIHL